MTLNRWDPLRDLLNFQERMNRLLDAGHRQTKPGACWCPPVDILETRSSYVLRIDLAGVGRDNINVEVQGNHLLISGERRIEEEPAFADYHSIERNHGPFERRFTLPGSVDVDKTEAKYVDGVLELTLPKCDDDKERNISVESVG